MASIPRSNAAFYIDKTSSKICKENGIYFSFSERKVGRSHLYWIGSGMIVFVSLLILWQVTQFQGDIRFSAALLPLFRINLYFVPFMALIVSSMLVLQEKSKRTLFVLLSSHFSPLRFLLEKSISIQLILFSVILNSYFIVLLISRFFLQADFLPFLAFLLSILALSAVFAQIGICVGVIMNHKMAAFAVCLLIWASFLYVYDLVLIYLIPAIGTDELFLFSLFYFFSPVHAIEYFLSVQLGFYPLDRNSAIFNQVLFRSPRLVLAANFLFWAGVSIIISHLVLKRKGIRE